VPVPGAAVGLGGLALTVAVRGSRPAWLAPSGPGFAITPAIAPGIAAAVAAAPATDAAPAAAPTIDAAHE
jgi:hypothetical protein